MKTVLILIPLAALLVAALVIRFNAAQATFNFLTADETDHATLLAPPAVAFVPDGFTCLRCLENPALPSPSIWCAVCTPVVDQNPFEPIERRPVPVADWDTYRIEYRSRAGRLLTGIFAAGSANAAVAAVLDRNSGATIHSYVNLTNNGHPERGSLA